MLSEQLLGFNLPLEHQALQCIRVVRGIRFPGDLQLECGPVY